MKNTNIITKISNGICSVERTVTWIAFAVMLALLLIQVLCRYCFNLPLAWAEELVRYTYIAVSFLGATVAVREKTHISIDILPNLMGAIVKNEKKRTVILDIVDILGAICGTVFFVFITMWMLDYNIDIADKNQITSSNEWPMWLMCAPVTLSCALMALHSALNAIELTISVVRIEKGGAVA